MTIEGVPNASNSINSQRANLKVKITSNTGILNNANIQYGFSYEQNTSVIDGWKTLPISVMGLNDQRKKIEKGESISLTSDKLITPLGATNPLYLVLRVNTLQDLYEYEWNSDPAKSEYVYIGPYKVDNTPPVFGTSSVVSTNSSFNHKLTILNLSTTDDNSNTTNMRMCISYETDTCPKDAKSAKDPSKYEAYQATKNLEELSGSYNGTTHKIYVNVADAAGNVVSKTLTYEVALTLSYNGNGNTGGNTEDTYCNRGTTCTLRANGFNRTNYGFLGWYTAASGGTKYDSSITLNANTEVFAQWLNKPSCTISLSGTKGINGWYKSNVTVTLNKDLVGDNQEWGLSASEKKPTNGTTTLTQKNDTTGVTYYGYVKNDVGEAECSEKVKKDTVPPSFTYRFGCMKSFYNLTAINNITDADEKHRRLCSKLGVKITYKDETSGLDINQFSMGDWPNDLLDVYERNEVPEDFPATGNIQISFKVRKLTDKAGNSATDNIGILFTSPDEFKTCNLLWEDLKYAANYTCP